MRRRIKKKYLKQVISEKDKTIQEQQGYIQMLEKELRKRRVGYNFGR